MRFALILVLAGGTTALGQTLANPNRVRTLISRLESPAGEQVLNCDVLPTKALLNYSFRYQAGYRVSVPMKQYSGSGHRWNTLVQVTPLSGSQRPVYLTGQYSLPNVPKTNAELQVAGAYQLGEGSYDVRFLLLDNSNRACRKSWKVDVRLARSERKVKVAMPPDTVWDLTLRGARTAQEKDDAAAMRLTVFLHTAPLFPRRTHMRANDMITLVSTVSSLLERLPTRNVRLVLFNLDQQRELYRKDNFQLREMGQVYQSMANIELGLVDYQVLQNHRGHVDLLSDLMNRELEEPEPSDLVLFLGPGTRFLDRMPTDSVDRPSRVGPQFFYFQLVPMPVFRDAGLTDLIKSALSRVGGKTIVIHSPGDFAKAIDRVEKLPRLTQQSASSAAR